MKNFGVLYAVGSVLQIMAVFVPVVGLIAAVITGLGQAPLLGLAIFAGACVLAAYLYGFGGLVCIMVAHFRAIEDLTDLIERQGIAAYTYQQPPRN